MIEPRPGMGARDLVPGDPDEVERLAGQFARFARNAKDAAGRLSGLDSTHWSGPAAERFRGAAREVPTAMRGGAEAFEAASTALRSYAQVLREGQRTAARAVGLAEEAERASAQWRQGGGAGDDPGEEQRRRARWLSERAADEVRRAAQAAAERLGQLSDQAPRGAAVISATPPGIRTVADHQLDRPDDYVAQLDQTSTEVRFGADHQAGFASDHGDWSSWAAGGEGREIGMISAEGAAGAALLLLGGARRRRRTALQTAGVDPAAVRRANRRGDGTVAQGAGGWRTNLAGRPRTGAGIRTWSGGGPLRHATPAASVPVEVSDDAGTGVVLHSGPPTATDH
jgi:hypothetical protein